MAAAVLGPRPSLAPGGTAAGWAVLAACWGLAALSALIWTAARIAAALTVGTVEPFGMTFIADLAHGRTGRAWPHTPAFAVTVPAAVLLALAASLPAHQPLASVRRAIDSSCAISEDDRAWLKDHCEQLLNAYGQLTFPLPAEMIHGDAYRGNLLYDGNRAVLADWDAVSSGHRESTSPHPPGCPVRTPRSPARRVRRRLRKGHPVLGRVPGPA
jgi:hypothetical protein